MALPPDDSASQKSADPRPPSESGVTALSTDADRLREKIKRIGDIQGVRFGNAGARLPNFNMDPNQVTRPQAPILAPPKPEPAPPAQQP
jgi:hypothetical protein